MLFSSEIEIFKRSDLLKYLVGAELKNTYKNKLLGFAWAILDPLFVMLVYVVLVSVIFKRGGDKFPVLLFSALLPWRWFVYSINSSVKTYMTNAKLIQSVKLPLAIFPYSNAILGGINYLMGLVVLMPLLFVFNSNMNINLLWILIIIPLLFMFVSGVSIIVAVVGVYFLDLQNILSFSLRIGFYLSPALYGLDDIPEKYRTIYVWLNPFASLFDSCKKVLVEGVTPDNNLWIFAMYAILFFILGSLVIELREKKLSKHL